jgi:hypothetical protein
MTSIRSRAFRVEVMESVLKVYRMLLEYNERGHTQTKAPEPNGMVFFGGSAHNACVVDPDYDRRLNDEDYYETTMPANMRYMSCCPHVPVVEFHFGMDDRFDHEQLLKCFVRPPKSVTLVEVEKPKLSIKVDEADPPVPPPLSELAFYSPTSPRKPLQSWGMRSRKVPPRIKLSKHKPTVRFNDETVTIERSENGLELLADTALKGAMGGTHGDSQASQVDLEGVD